MTTHRLDETAAGVYIISATPFTDNGALDLESAKRLIDFYIEKEVTGITILGMMGEAQKLTSDESELFLSTVMKHVNGRVPIVVGVSNAGTDNLVSLAKSSMDKGAAGVMVAPVSGLGTDDKVYNYFLQVFAALGDDIPVCYQDYPLSTKTETSVSVFNRLVQEFDQLVVFKHEECPGLSKVTQLRESSTEQDIRRVSILVGNGALYLPQELQRGVDGAMTGFAFPEMLVDVVRLHRDGQIDKAEDLFDAYLPIVRHEQQPGFGMALRKEILRRRGAISSAKVRSPGAALNDTDHAELTRILSRVDRNAKAL
jgi:4-hydroxy-tetrahydrodipicolinate synthase